MRTHRLVPLLLLLSLIALSITLCGCSAHRRAGTGDVAFRLLWEGVTDLDLFVQDPSGECISFSQRDVASGGTLDVDCNSGTDGLCEHPIENVFWAAASAPPGPYTFWVHAHSLIPAEAPVGFELQVLRGPRVTWRHEGRMVAHDEVDGPYRLDLPDAPLPRATGEAAPPRCGLPYPVGATPPSPGD